MAMILSKSRLRVTQAKFFGNAQTAGNVTSLTAGTGINLTPDPIIATGTIAVSTVPVGNGGTGANLAATGGAGQYVKQVGVGANFTVGTIPYTDVGAGYVKVNGTTPLTAGWNAGNFRIDSQNSTRWFNIRSYGAVGNGIADDSAAIQAALTAANAAGGGTVYVPVGIYLCYNLTIYGNTRLLGDGGGILKLSSAASDAQDLLHNATPGAYTDANITIEGLKFDGNNQGADLGGGQHRFATALTFARVTNLTIRNCWLTNLQYYHTSLSGCRTALIQGNYFTTNGYQGSVANGGGSFWCGGAGSDPSVNIEVTNNSFISNYYCSLFAPQRSCFSNNIIYDSGESGIFVSGLAGVGEISKDIVFSGNVIDTVHKRFISGSGMEIAACQVTIIGNTVRNTAHAGIVVEDVHNAVIVGNNVYNASQDGASTAAGISVISTLPGAARTQDVIVSGNIIGDDTGTPLASAGIGLYSASTAMSNIDITGNHIQPVVWDGGTNINIVTGAIDATCEIFDHARSNTTMVLSRNTIIPPAPHNADTLLQIVGVDGTHSPVEIDAFGTAVAPHFNLRRSRGIASAPTAVQNNDVLGAIQAYGYGASAYSSATRCADYMVAAEAWTNSAQGTRRVFQTTQATTTTTAEKFAIENDGLLTNTLRTLALKTPGVMFTQTADATTTPNVATTLFGTGVGTLTLPANFLIVGRTIRIKLAGYVSVADGGAGTKTLLLSLGGVTVATIASGGTITTGLNRAWEASAVITCRTTGGGGTVVGGARWSTEDGSVGSREVLANGNTTAACNTTGTLAINLTFNNGNATGTITTTNAVVEVLN